MYELTASEAATVLSVLSRRPGIESTEPELYGVPNSTFYATRRKIYSSGWLSDRFVPHPWAIGISSVDFVVATPGPAESARLETDLASSPATVVLWVGLNALFAVSYRADGDAPAEASGDSIAVKPGSGSIPAYFDYSRSWSRFVGIERETGYPRSLGGADVPATRTPLTTIAEALSDDDRESGEKSRAHPWHSSVSFSPSQQKLLGKGVIESRSLLNVDRVPPFENRALGEIVFITGELREGTPPTRILGALHNECNVSPIVFAEDGENLVIVALGQLATGSTRRTKLPRATGHVAGTLDSSLKHVKMVVERSDSVRMVVNHRYDRLIPRLRESKPGASVEAG